MSYVIQGQEEVKQPISKEAKLKFGVQVSYINDGELYFNDGAEFASSVTFRYKKHLAQIGPIWWFDKNKDVDVFRGLIISYQFFPKELSKTLNFYFLYDLSYTFENGEMQSKAHFYPTHPINEIYNINTSTSWQTLSNHVGYGFRVNVFKGLYIDQNFSLGIEIHRYTSENEVVEDPSLSYNFKSSGHGTNMFLKLGIGYNFK